MCSSTGISWERTANEDLEDVGHRLRQHRHVQAPLPGKLAKLDSLWKRGFVANYQAQSGEHMVIDKNGEYHLLQKDYSYKY